MNTADPPLREDTFLATALPLLLEHTKKIKSIAIRSKRILNVIHDFMNVVGQSDTVRLLELDFLRLYEYHKQIKPIAYELAQHVSQRIEYGKLDELASIELRFHLAEFEYAMKSTDEKMTVLHDCLTRLDLSANI